MRDLFRKDRGLEMPRGGDTAGIDPLGGAAGLGQEGARYPLQGRHVCPFCGSVNETMEGPCPQCTMGNTAETRKATKSRIGPWYVLQSRNPAAPGMKYQTLLGFVRKGRVKARSIVRGPTTHQLWRFACQVKGLSREFGVCYSCAGSIDRAARVCPQCNRPQDPPVDPDTFIEGVANGAAPAPSAALMPTSTFGTAAVTLGPNITLSSVADSPAEATRPEPTPARPAMFKELTVPATSDEPVATPAPVAAKETKVAPTAPESPA